MTPFLHKLFLDNPQIPEQIYRFCSEMPEYVRAQEEYSTLAQELEQAMGRQWYFTFERKLNQYWALENQAYYLFGLNLRREILEGLQVER